MLNVRNALHKILSQNKKCIMQWVPAHIGIDENETADTLAKETRKLNNDQLPCVVTLKDINNMAKSKLKNKAVKLKHQICELNTSRTLANILTRLRTRHLRGMKIQKGGSKKHLTCRNCGSDTELSPELLFSCPANLPTLQQISNYPQEGLRWDNCLEITEAVYGIFGPKYCQMNYLPCP